MAPKNCACTHTKGEFQCYPGNTIFQSPASTKPYEFGEINCDGVEYIISNKENKCDLSKDKKTVSCPHNIKFKCDGHFTSGSAYDQASFLGFYCNEGAASSWF